jgi:hypothetical protein
MIEIPPTWEVELGGSSSFKASQAKKVSQTPSQRTSWGWWFTTIPAILEAQIGGSLSEASSGQQV